MPAAKNLFAVLTFDDQHELNVACDQFEEALLQGSRPRIEDFLREVPDRLEPLLFRELVILEWEYALRQGEDPHALGLLERFADRVGCIREAIELAGRNAAIASKVAEERPRPAPPFAAPMSLPNQFGRFRLHEPVGHGAFGAVFRAIDTNDGSEVALKIPHIVTLISPELRERFVREARAAAALDHPGIVHIRDVGEEGLISYIASEYVPGTTLAARLHELYMKQERMAPRTAARLTAQLATAMQHAHERGIFHYDLKPANVLLRDGPAPIPVVTDFGLARIVGDPAELTRTGQILGTPAYMAPEQAFGPGRTLGPAPDIYALGAIFYEMLTGRPPHQGRTPLETLEQKRNTDPTSPRALVPGLPRELETVCLKCLEEPPSKRYQSAGLLAEDLQRWLRGERVRARGLGRLGRIWRVCRRRPGVAFLSAALLVAVAAGLGGVFYEWQKVLTARDAALDSESRALASEAQGRASEAQARASEAQARASEAQALADEAQAHQVLTKFTDVTISAIRRLVPPRSYQKESSIELLLQADRHWSKLLDRRPDDSAARVALVRVCAALSSLYTAKGQLPEAATWLQKILAVWEPVLRRDAANLEARRWLRQVCDWQVVLCRRMDNLTECFRWQLREEEIWLGLAEEIPKEYAPGNSARLFEELSHWNGRFTTTWVRDGAVHQLRDTREMLRKLAGARPADPVLWERLGLVCCYLGDICHQDGANADAKRYWTEAYEHLSEAAKTTHNAFLVDVLLSQCCLRLTAERTSESFAAKAVTLLERCSKKIAVALEHNPASVSTWEALFQCESFLAYCYWKGGPL